MASRQNEEIRALTGLRGVAALLVAIYHSYPYAFVPWPALSRADSKGYLWVDLFFVLSGYVMALNYAHLFAGRVTCAAFLDFMRRRFARIYPLYGALLLARLLYTWLAIGNFHDEHAWAAVHATHPAFDVSANLLLVQSWGLSESVNGPAWSVSAECGAYMLFPLLVGAVLAGKAWRAVAAAFCCAALLVVVLQLDLHDHAFHSGPLDAYDGRHAAPMLRCIAGFVLGLVTYRVAQWQPAAGIAGSDAFGLLVMAALLALLFGGAPDLAIYACFPPMVLCLSGNRGVVGRAFACRPVFVLGVLSYAIYLLHVFLIGPRDIVRDWLRALMPEPAAQLLAGLAALAALLGLAALAYRFVERPGRELVRRLGRGARTRSFGVRAPNGAPLDAAD